MSVSELYTICALKLGTTVIAQITDQSVPTNIQELLTGDSGGVYARGSTVGQEDQRYRITTEAVKTALAAVPLTGLAITSPAPAIVYFQKYAAGGTRTANACVAFKFEAGMVVRRRLTASGGKLAAVEIEVIGISDGTNAPFTKLTGQAIPAIPSTPEMYVAGGSDGVQNLTIDYGVKEQLVYSDGLAWPTFAAVEGIQPKITVSKTTMGTLGAGSITSVQLVSRNQGGYVGSSPITFTFNRQYAYARNIGGRPSLTEYEITPTFDGTNAPIVETGLT